MALKKSTISGWPMPNENSNGRLPDPYRFFREEEYVAMPKRSQGSGAEPQNTDGETGSLTYDDLVPYLSAVGTGVGLAADAYNTANSYTWNTFEAEPVKVPTSQYGLGRLSREPMVPGRSREDFGYMGLFCNGGRMGHKYGHGGYWPDTLGAITAGAGAGSMIAPGVGTLIGGVLGGVSSIIGNEVRNMNAEREAELYNVQRMQQEANKAYALGLGAKQIGHDRVGYAQRNYVYADGGGLRSVMDAGNGVTMIEEGGSHARNRNGGVPMGNAPDGLPNLVEEGEVKWDKENYIFSNRLKPTPRLLKDHVLDEKKYQGMTYADIAKKIQKVSEERENDPVARDTVDELLGRLMDAQEVTRAEKYIKEMQKAIAQMSPEEVASLMQMQAIPAMQGAIPPAMPAAAPAEAQQTPAVDPYAMGIGQAPAMEQQGMIQPPMMAMGGHLFPDGGPTDIPQNNDLTFDFTHGGWGSEDGAAWNGSTDAAWIEALELAAKDGIDLRTQGMPKVAEYLQKTNAYRYGYDWLNKSDENRRRYLAAIVQSKEAPKAAKNFAKRFVNDKGEWLEGAKKDYQSIFGKVRETHPGTYWKTPNEVIAEMTQPAAPAAPAPAPAAPVLQNPATGIRYYIRNGQNYDLIGNPDQYNTWVMSHANYTLPNQFRKMNENGVDYTDYYVETERPMTPFPRYRPWPGIVNAGIGLMSGFNAPDYEKANIIDSYRAEPVDFKPIGDYLPYDPMDENYIANVSRSQAAATRAALRNGISPSTDAALLGADYTATLGLGNNFETVRNNNQGMSDKVAEFNRGTDQYNASAENAAENTNFGLNGLRWDQVKAYADARDAATTLASQANSAAISSAMGNLNEAYKDWYNTNALGWLVDQNIYHGVGLEGLGLGRRKNKR